MDHVLRCHDIVKTDFIRAEGCWLYDASGRRYTDFEAGIWCTAVGYNHPRIQQVMLDQIGKVSHLGTRYPNGLVEAAAQALLEVTHPQNGQWEPGKCTFLSTGSEAVEFGVQAALRLAGRSSAGPRLLTFANTFLASYGSAGQKRPEDWICFDWSVCAGCPQAEVCSADCPHLQTIPFEALAAFVFDGGNASGQVRLPPPGLVQMLARQVQAGGGFFVANEVTAGMGRTGAWFGYQHYAVRPDIVAVGKGLGNGYPVSAVAMTHPVAHRLESSGLRYAQSHQNDPLGAAVAKEVLAVMQEEALVELSRRVGAQFLQALNTLTADHAQIKEARGRGLMIVLEFVPGVDVTLFYQQLLAHGLLVGYTPAANLLRFYPALTIGEDDIAQLIRALDEILL